jgi:hypothetical protein
MERNRFLVCNLKTLDYSGWAGQGVGTGSSIALIAKRGILIAIRESTEEASL